MTSQIPELYKKTNEIRNQIIQNFDNQVQNLRGLFGTIVSALIAAGIVTHKELLLLGIVVVSILFWLTEASIKKNQRGYILISNEIQKAMTNAKSDSDVYEVMKKFHSDLNGFYSFRKEKPKYYKKVTGFLHTMFIWNVSMLYLCTIVILAVIFIVWKVFFI